MTDDATKAMARRYDSSLEKLQKALHVYCVFYTWKKFEALGRLWSSLASTIAILTVTH